MAETLKARASALIDALASGGRDDDVRDALILDALRHQASRIPAYGRLAGANTSTALPALPTDVFRYARIAVHEEEEDIRTFRTSGTTDSIRGAHHFRDLSLYDRAAHAAASYALFFEGKKHLIILAPTPAEAPDSSLSYMLGRFGEWFATEVTYVWRQGQLDIGLLHKTIHEAAEPLALLGTSFAFVHADDGLDGTCRLPDQSLIMQTGGFKGRSRTLEPTEMLHLLSTRFCIPENRIVAEYGMTELSSQMYETCLFDPSGPRRLWVPGWVKAEVVDPESLRPKTDGIGILRIEDAANIDSVSAIQTADFARYVGDGIEVLGRDPNAVPRGCSLAVDTALARS